MFKFCIAIICIQIAFSTSNVHDIINTIHANMMLKLEVQDLINSLSHSLDVQVQFNINLNHQKRTAGAV